MAGKYAGLSPAEIDARLREEEETQLEAGLQQIIAECQVGSINYPDALPVFQRIARLAGHWREQIKQQAEQAERKGEATE